jgi:hypothetical protein
MRRRDIGEIRSASKRIDAIRRVIVSMSSRVIASSASTRAGIRELQDLPPFRGLLESLTVHHLGLPRVSTAATGNAYGCLQVWTGVRPDNINMNDRLSEGIAHQLLGFLVQYRIDLRTVFSAPARCTRYCQHFDGSFFPTGCSIPTRHAFGPTLLT